MHLTRYEKFWLTWLTPTVLQVGLLIYATRRGVRINYAENIVNVPIWWPIITLVPFAYWYDIEPVLRWFNVEPRRRPENQPDDEQ